MEDSLLDDVFGPPSPPPDCPASPLSPAVALRDCSECECLSGQGSREWTRVEEVEGLWLCREFLTKKEQSVVLNAIAREKWFDPPVKNQAMRFGNLPPIAMHLTKLIRTAASERALVPAAADAAAASSQATVAIRGDRAVAVEGVDGACGVMSEERDGGGGNGAPGSPKRSGGEGDGNGSGEEFVLDRSEGREEGARDDGEEHWRSGCCGKRRKKRQHEGDSEDVSRREEGRGVQEQGGEGVQEANGPEDVLSAKHATTELFQVVGAGPENDERLQKAGTDAKVGSELLQVVGPEDDEAEQLRVHPLSRRVLQREPLFDQMIANWYSGDQGIKPHVDLMRFDDGIAILSLLSPCVMTLAPALPTTITPNPTPTTTVNPTSTILSTATTSLPTSPPGFPDQPPSSIAAMPLPFSDAADAPSTAARPSDRPYDLGFSVPLLLAPGDLLLLSGPARYNWSHARALYRDALRTARLAPSESRADLQKMIRDEAEKHAGESDISKIRFHMSEGIQRLKELKTMLDNQGR
ncbi:unnamed protein product [Closterium sp. NIES-54]